MPGSRDHWTGKTLYAVDRSQAMEALEKGRDELESGNQVSILNQGLVEILGVFFPKIRMSS